MARYHLFHLLSSILSLIKTSTRLLVPPIPLEYLHAISTKFGARTLVLFRFNFVKDNVSRRGLDKMVEPLSIAASIFSALSVCVKVGTKLSAFRNGVQTVDDRIELLAQDVDRLTNALEALDQTTKVLESQGPLQTTGHIGTHWKNLSQSLEDGKRTLCELENLLSQIDKEVSFLNGARKERRMKEAQDMIAAFHRRAQSIPDVIQLSLQIITL